MIDKLRRFFKILFTRRPPTIWGDGLHDDAKGMQAAMYGKDFLSRNGCVRVENGRVWMAPATFICGKTLKVPSGTTLKGDSK